jgi:Tfp pilus assembly protein PilW
MARQQSSQGFSLVEMMVAMMFTAILVAGMASVFRASLSLSTTVDEKIGSLRRNRASLDLLYDDLNSAGMVLTDVTTPLPSSSTNPPFYIIPNVPIATPSAGFRAGDPTSSDNLYFAFDQAMPFDGQLGAPPANEDAGSLVLDGGAANHTFYVDCLDQAYAKSVSDLWTAISTAAAAAGSSYPGGMYLKFKASSQPPTVQVTNATSSGTTVTVTTASTPSTQMAVTGRGDSTAASSAALVAGSGVVFIQKQQMVRYRIAMLNLDPAVDPTDNKLHPIPCLIREQGVFDPGSAFAPIASQTQVIAENVGAFKVYLSADSGADWAGTELPATTTSTDITGWNDYLVPDINTQLTSVGRPGFLTTAGDPNWYRDNPILLRLDITTRTAVKRSEYSSNGASLAFKTVTQSVVLVPRHFGLPLN